MKNRRDHHGHDRNHDHGRDHDQFERLGGGMMGKKNLEGEGALPQVNNNCYFAFNGTVSKSSWRPSTR